MKKALACMLIALQLFGLLPAALAADTVTLDEETQTQTPDVGV